MKQGIEEFVVCSCATEGLYIVKYKGESEVYFSIFSHGINPKRMFLKNIIRYIWKLLKTGKPFEDELVLDQKSIKKIIAVLKRAVDK